MRTRQGLGCVLMMLCGVLAARAYHCTFRPPPPPPPVDDGPGGSTAPPTGPAIEPAAGTTGVNPNPAATGPTTGGRGRGNRTAVGGRRAVSGNDLWEYWWECNKDAYLLVRPLVVSTSGLAHPTSNASGSVSAAVVKTEILPALLAGLTDADRHVVNSSILSIGRAVPAAMAPLILPDVSGCLASPHATVRDCATLAFGTLGSPRANSVLDELLRDTPRARSEFLGASTTADHVRGFAAISLGLIGDPSTAAVLRSMIDRLPQNREQGDLAACAITALGLVQETQAEIAPYLIGLLDRPDLDAVVRAQVPIALARRGAVGAVPILLQEATVGKPDLHVRRSAIIALGKLASLDQAEVLRTLEDVAMNDRDPSARSFAWIAMAEIGARDQDRVTHAAAHAALARLLQESLLLPRDPRAVPWLALALGIYGRAHATGAAALQQAYRATSNPSDKAALAIGAGLVNACELAHVLERDLRSSHDPLLQGYLALALGLLGHTAILDDVRALVLRPGLDFRCRLNLATALKLLRDDRIATQLVAALARTGSQSDSSSLALAIGVLRDERTIDPLKRIMSDHSRSSIQRDYAALALGLLAEKTPLPRRATITAGMNYHATTPSLAELLRTL